MEKDFQAYSKQIFKVGEGGSVLGVGVYNVPSATFTEGLFS